MAATSYADHHSHRRERRRSRRAAPTPPLLPPALAPLTYALKPRSLASKSAVMGAVEEDEEDRAERPLFLLASERGAARRSAT